MTKKLSQKLHLIVAIVLAVVSITMLIVATVSTVHIEDTPISHDLAIKEVNLDSERSDESVRLLCHDVVINGQVRNYSDLELGQVELQIVIEGVSKFSGESMEFTYTKTIESFDSNETYNMVNEKFTIMSRDGYIPEKIKEVRIAVAGGYYIADYQKSNDANLVAFAIAVGALFASVIMFAKWYKLMKNNPFRIREDVTTK